MESQEYTVGRRLEFQQPTFLIVNGACTPSVRCPAPVALLSLVVYRSFSSHPLSPHTQSNPLVPGPENGWF